MLSLGSVSKTTIAKLNRICQNLCLWYVKDHPVQMIATANDTVAIDESVFTKRKVLN